MEAPGGQDGPGRPGPGAHVALCLAPKSAMVGTIEAVAALCNEPVLDAAGRRRYGGHSLRVIGAQFLASAGIPLLTIQLLGRWASDAICRYVAEAPLHSLAADLLQGAERSRTERIVDDLKDRVAEVAKLHEALVARTREQAAAEAVVPVPPSQGQRDPFFVVNEMAPQRTIHKAWLGSEQDYPPSFWRAPCGWQYGLAAHTRAHSFPPGSRRLCRRCFCAERREAAGSSSSSSSSSSGTGS